MEHDLGGGHHVEPPVGVQGGIGSEGLHHGLLDSLGVVHPVDDDVAAGQHTLHVPAGVAAAGGEVAPVVAAHLADGVPVLLRVDQYGAVLGGPGVQHRLQDLVLHLDAPHGPEGGPLVLGGDNGHRVPGKAQMPVQDQPVVGGGLRVSLPGDGEAALGHVPPGVYRRHAGDLQRGGYVDVLHQGVGVGAAQQLDRQRPGGRDVAGVHRPAQQQRHGVLFGQGLAHHAVGFHASAPFRLSR